MNKIFPRIRFFQCFSIEKLIIEFYNGYGHFPKNKKGIIFSHIFSGMNKWRVKDAKIYNC